MIIKTLLILALAIIFLYFLKNSEKTRVKAWTKLAMVAIGILGIISVLDPDIIESLARYVGVGRGTDLLLYSFIMATVFILTSFYIKIREIKHRQDIIISHLTIIESAGQKYEDKTGMSITPKAK